MVPLSRRLELGQNVEQSFSHGDDPVGHLLDLGQPFLKQLLVAEDRGDKLGTVDWRARVQGSNDSLDLGKDPLLLFGGRNDHGECTGSFTVKTQVLGVRLAENDLVALFDEVSNGKGVTLEITRGESLVGLG